MTENKRLQVFEALVRYIPPRVGLKLYSLRPVASFVRRTLNRYVPEGVVEATITGGPLRGCKMLLNLKEEKYLWLGTYEPWVGKAIEDILSPGDIGWDIGAYIGYHTLLMCRITNPKNVIAIEPDPLNRGRLEANLALNGFELVKVVAAVAGSSRSTSHLQRIPGLPPQSYVAPRGVPVRQIPLDSLLSDHPPPSLVKLDVEGSELAVIEGSRKLLKEVRPTWVIEIHGEMDPRIDRLLADHDYEVIRIGKGVGVPQDLPVGGPSHILAIPRS